MDAFEIHQGGLNAVSSVSVHRRRFCDIPQQVQKSGVRAAVSDCCWRRITVCSVVCDYTQLTSV